MRAKTPVRRPRSKPPPPPGRKPPHDREEARRLYLEEGLTVVEVARRMGYAFKTVHGALREEGLGRRTHASRRGKWAATLYRRWKGMRRKCHARSDGQYQNYGGRGIGICEEWESFPAFQAWALESGFRPGLDLTLVRRDRDFSPKNCRWRTRSQSRLLAVADGRIPTRELTAFGETKSLTEWAADRRCKVSRSALSQRLRAGHSPEAAITFPSHAIIAVAKPRRRPWKPKPRRRREVDWKAVERQWRRRPTSYAEVARRLRVSSSAVRFHLGHLPRPTRERILPPRQEENLGKIWRRLVAKCTRPSDPLYRYIGAKGIPLARAWRELDGFLAWAARSGYRPGLWLARLDRRKGYTPANCRWLTPAEAMRQRKFEVKSPPPGWALDGFGETKSLSAWSRDPRCAVSAATLAKRLRAGWALEEALATPPTKRGRKPRILLSAFGETKSINAWAKDRRCKVGPDGLRHRVRSGIPAKLAITTPGHLLPPDLPRVKARKRLVAHSASRSRQRPSKTARSQTT